MQLKVGKTTIDVAWGRLDRAIEAWAPVWAARRLQARVGHALTASMGGYNGASQDRRSLSGWNPLNGDADADTLRNLPTLRARSSDLVRNAPVAGGAVATEVTHVIGSGLALQSVVDNEFLGLSDDQADVWQQDVERKFNAWFESTDCDITRTQNGYGLQDLNYRSELERGDSLCILTQAPWARGPVKLALQIIEADRLCNPDRRPNTARMVEGVSLDENGAPVNYHVASANPYRRSGPGALSKLTWTEVPAFSSRSGRRNVLHTFDRKRPGQTRGVPMLAPVIEPLKQLERYTEAELMAAVVSGLFTVFIESESPANLQPSALSGSASSGGAKGQLGNGLWVELGKGEKITTANPGRPNAEFDPFVQAIIRQIGLRLEIPYEVLVKHYTSSYTAARAAMEDAWRHFFTRRQRRAEQFCQPIYEAWLDEAVANGYVRAPGYFASPLVRLAWQGAMWIGDGPGILDPVKEIEAAERRVALTISTRQGESLLYDGGKWRQKVRQLRREKVVLDMADLGAPKPQPQSPAVSPAMRPPGQDGTDDDTEM